MRLIGFSHGVTFKILDPYSRDNMNLFKNCGCNAIEVHYHSINEIDKLNSIEKFMDNFEYKSIHLPCDLKYRNDKTTNQLLSKIEIYYNKIGAKLAVMHPDLIENAEVFDEYRSVSWAIENMDDRKSGYKNVNDLEIFFDANKHWGLVLDVGHCNANDKTMKLADDLISKFKSRIKEIHLSGYEIFHDPIHRTKQTDIIRYCKDLKVPIIIESTFEKTDGINGIAKEFNYIVKNL